MANVPVCPLLLLLAVTQSTDQRTLQYNFEQIVEWTKQACIYIDALEARIAALEAGP